MADKSLGWSFEMNCEEIQIMRENKVRSAVYIPKWNSHIWQYA